VAEVHGRKRLQPVFYRVMQMSFESRSIVIAVLQISTSPPDTVFAKHYFTKTCQVTASKMPQIKYRIARNEKKRSVSL
jgi:hypothetical protein